MLTAVCCLALCSHAHAQSADASPAGGIDVFASDDADNTRITRLGVLADWRHPDPLHFAGLELERRSISIRDRDHWTSDRVFFRFADVNKTWQWNGRVGSDGHELLGNASLVRPGRHRVELFAERDVLETFQGLSQSRVVTFAGAAVDIPLGAGDRRQLTLLGGLQDFDDGNLRTHLRANVVQVLSERLGLSAQLRVRSFEDSIPFNGDYFSPKSFFEAVPVLQLRRRLAGGWSATVAAGAGRQIHSGADWRDARLFQATLVSPAIAGRSTFRLDFIQTATPGIAGEGYGYRQLGVQWVHPL